MSLPRSATNKSTTAIAPERTKDKLMSSIKKKASDTGQWMPAAKNLFATLLNEMGDARELDIDDVYALAINLFSQEKYLAAKSVVEKFAKVPRFILLNALCNVCIVLLIIPYSLD
jgi:hypothetical protein